MSDAEVRAVVASRLDRAMHEHEQRLRMQRYGLIVGIMVLVTAITFAIYVYSMKENIGETYKLLGPILAGPFVALWGGALGIYFSRKSKDEISNKYESNDLDVYRELISSKEEAARLRSLIKKQMLEYEDKIYDLSKKVTQLEKSKGSTS